MGRLIINADDFGLTTGVNRAIIFLRKPAALLSDSPLAPEDRYFVHPRHLAAFSFQGGGGLHTQLGRLLSPSCWGIQHPLPVVVQGPGAVVVYAENLYVAAVTTPAQAEYIPDQIVAFENRYGRENT